MAWQQAHLTKPYSTASYAEIVVAFLDAGYAFVPFDGEALPDRAVFLRHDVDYSLHNAVEMAEWNHQLGVTGTFFFRVRAPLYNLFSPAAQAALRDVVGRFGQRPALHYSIDHESSLGASLDEGIRADLSVLDSALGDLAGQPTKVFSWHNPGVIFDEKPDLLRCEYEGLVNTYGLLHGANLPYFADSNMRRSVEFFLSLPGSEKLAVLIVGREKSAVQLNFHPFQWMGGRTEMFDVLCDLIAQKAVESGDEMSVNYVFQDRLAGEFPQSFLPELREFVRAALTRGNSG